jgi:hypothetical protein
MEDYYSDAEIAIEDVSAFRDAVLALKKIGGNTDLEKCLSDLIQLAESAISRRCSIHLIAD